MKRRTIVITVGISLGLILLFAVGSHPFSKWKATRPTKDNFDKAVRKIWGKNTETRNFNGFADPPNPLCISVPTDPAPDARSRAQQPLAWHLDFILGTTQTEDRKQQLRQLDALCKVGLLEKSTITVNLNNKTLPVTRYKLTEKGWVASGYSEEQSTCFVYGTPRYLGLSQFEPTIVHRQNGAEVYEVHAKSGLGSDADLSPWARDQEVQAAFPDIAESLKGQDFAVLLVRSEDEWVDYQTMVQDEARKKALKSAVHPNSAQPMPDKMKRRIDELSSLSPPTIDEVKKLLQVTYGVDPQIPSPFHCLELPGSEKLPVDRTLLIYSPSHYSVAIFSNKERTEYDRVANKTIPYLNILERLGILKKHERSRILGEGEDSRTLFDAYVYELTQSYLNRIDSTYPECFPLGEPSVEFVDIQIAEKNVNGFIYGFPFSSFRYKLRLKYKNPPDWMTDPRLMSEWSELRGVLEHGRACEGEFAFNRKTREMYSGVGSCWWAFDSYYENY